MQHFSTREELAEAEVKAIQSEKPKHNRAHAVIPLSDRIGVKFTGNHLPAVSIFGADANAFPSPEAIACDDPAPVLVPDEPRVWQSWRCTECKSRTVYREYDDLVRCDTCLNMWLWDEWKKLNLALPRPTDTPTACA